MVAIRSPAQAQRLHRASQGIRAWFNRLLHPDTTNALQVYDPATNSWSSGPNLNEQRSFPAGTDVGNTAVAVGGYTGCTTTDLGGDQCRDWRMRQSYAYSYTNCDGHTYGDGNSNVYADSDCHIHSDGDGDSNVHANSHSNCYAYTDSYANGHSNDNCDRTAAAYADATASADTAAACEQLLCKF